MATAFIHCNNTRLQAVVNTHVAYDKQFTELHINTANDTLHLMDVTIEQLTAVHNAISEHLFSTQMQVEKEEAQCPSITLTSC